MSVNLPNKQLNKFNFWVQRVLPQVYDDSLSYYELLNKVVHHLNEVIESQNHTNDNFTHVLDFFKNLDVKDEVNSKLDDLVADGTLDVIINQNIFNDLNVQLAQTVQTEKTNINKYVDIQLSDFELKDLTAKQRNTNDNQNVLRVATYNIFSIGLFNPKLLHLAKRTILKSKSHLCGTQEMYDSDTFKFNSQMVFDLFPHGFFRTSVENYSGHKYGNGIISGLTLTENTGANLNMQGSGLEQRSYQRSVITHKGRTFAIYNTHLTHDNTSVRQAQINELFGVVNNDPIQRRILLGDFNTDDLNTFSLFTGAGYKLVNTGQYKTSKNSNKAIDNIIVSGNINIVGSGMIESGADSDHHLIYADLQ